MYFQRHVPRQVLLAFFALLLAHLNGPSHAFSLAPASTCFAPVLMHTRGDLAGLYSAASAFRFSTGASCVLRRGPKVWHLRPTGASVPALHQISMSSAGGGNEHGTGGLDKLGLPKSVQNEMQGLSQEEQNMILGAVGLSPLAPNDKKRTNKKNSRQSGAGSGKCVLAKSQ